MQRERSRQILQVKKLTKNILPLDTTDVLVSIISKWQDKLWHHMSTSVMHQ